MMSNGKMDQIIHKLLIGTHLQLPVTSGEVSAEVELQKLVGKGLKILSEQQSGDWHGSELANCAILLAVNMKIERWNNQNQVNEARAILRKLTRDVWDTEKAGLDLLKHNPSVCKKINEVITQTLKRDTWEKHAVACQLFSWYCHHLRFPQISDHLDVLLPPCLNFMDSYDDDMKHFGLKSLHHLLSESGQAELLWHNRAQVIYDVLHKLTYIKNEKLIVLLHPTMIKILDVFHKDLSRPKAPNYENTEYHELLSGMFLEDKLVHRRVFANCMKLYIGFLQGRVIKHLKLTMEILLNYLEDSCGSAELTRLTMLEVSHTILGVAQPRVRRYYDDIVKHLFRLVIDVCMLKMEQESKDHIIEYVSKLLNIIEDDDYKVKPVLELIINQLPSDKTTGKTTISTLQRIKAAFK